MKHSALALLLAISTLSSGCCREGRVGIGWFWGMFHNLIVPPQRFVLDDLPHGIQGVRANGSIIWVLPVDDGVVLLDAGFDETCHVVQQALAGREVHAVFLTHSHIDHISAAHCFDQVPVYIGAADFDAVGTAGQNGVFMTRVYETLLQHPPAPPRLNAVKDGQCINIGGAELCAIHLPGHTPGGVGWQHERVLFYGDVLWTSPVDGDSAALRLEPLPDDPEQSLRNFLRLSELDIDLALDGHWGIVRDASRRIQEAIPMHSDDEE